MIWIIFLLVILQAGFHWFLEPVILLTTNLFELRIIGLLLLLGLIWLFSASNPKKDFQE